jgi:hypothetical protein
MTEAQKAARVAGGAYVVAFAAILSATYAIYPQIFVAGDPSATTRNLIAHERLFRTTILLAVVHAAGVMVYLSAVYRILAPAGRTIALAASCFRFSTALLWLVTAVAGLGATRFLTTAMYAQALEPPQLHAIARVALGAGFDTYYVGLPLYGLALTLYAWLWWRSRLIPRWFAAFGLLASAWCALSSAIFLVFPSFGQSTQLYLFDTAMGIFDLGLALLLLIRGIPAQRVAE